MSGSGSHAPQTLFVTCVALHVTAVSQASHNCITTRPQMSRVYFRLGNVGHIRCSIVRPQVFGKRMLVRAMTSDRRTSSCSVGVCLVTSRPRCLFIHTHATRRTCLGQPSKTAGIVAVASADGVTSPSMSRATPQMSRVYPELSRAITTNVSRAVDPADDWPPPRCVRASPRMSRGGTRLSRELPQMSRCTSTNVSRAALLNGSAAFTATVVTRYG